MKACLLCFFVGATSLFAEFTPENRAAVLKIASTEVEEKVDDFEKMTVLKFTGPALQFKYNAECTANATWRNQDLQTVFFHLVFTRVDDGWRWLKSNEAKILVDDERMEIEQTRLSSDVMENGKVYEGKTVLLTLEQTLQLIAAEQVRIKIGPDEYVFAEKERAPLQMVLYYWIGKGGDVAGYKELMQRIVRPSAGTVFAEVVKKHGAPVWRDPETGWATWKSFWVRFKDGKVIETRPRNINKKAAH